MSTQDERQSLVQEPLPVILPSGVVPSLVLTHIASLDQEIERQRQERDTKSKPHDETIERLKEERENALKYAIEHNITEDDQYRLDKIIIQPQQKVDVKLLQDRYPMALNWIYAQRTAALEAAAADMREMKTEISPSQDEAKSALKTINMPLRAVLYRPGESKVNYSVVKKA